MQDRWAVIPTNSFGQTCMSLGRPGFGAVVNDPDLRISVVLGGAAFTSIFTRSLDADSIGSGSGSGVGSASTLAGSPIVCAPAGLAVSPDGGAS